MNLKEMDLLVKKYPTGKRNNTVTTCVHVSQLKK